MRRRAIMRHGPRLLAACLLLCGIVMVTTCATAQRLASTEITVYITVPPVLLVESESEQITFTADEIQAAGLVDGRIIVEKGRAIRLTTAANVPYSLWISTDADVLRGPNGTIPVSRLQWRTEDGPWLPLAPEMQLVRETIDPARHEIEVDLRLVLEITDPPGDYEGEVVFTLQHPLA